MDFLILILATWRVTSLLSSEAGPYAVLDKLRHAAGVRYADDGTPQAGNELAKALICPWCLSVWVGLALGAAWLVWPGGVFCIALPLALSAGVIIVEGIVNK